METSNWNIEASEFSKKTLNPLRILWERHQPAANPNKSSIILQAGDPTTFGNFPPHPICIQAIKEAADIDKFGYHVSAGLEIARSAIAEYSQHQGHVVADDVFLASGGSMTIEMCVRALANPGDNILVPRPAWNYTTWILGSGIDAVFYNLLPDQDWQIDLNHLEGQINDKTRGIILNSPGNPCGNVFSREHILDILKIAERHQLPIISDEIYEFFTFPGVEFHSIASLSKNVPVLTCSGTAKRHLVPGNRVGWVIVNDRGNKLVKIREALKNIVGRNFMPNSTFQIALAKMLKEIPDEFYKGVVEKVAVSNNSYLKSINY
jgi:tyrosine aminotransferase